MMEEVFILSCAQFSSFLPHYLTALILGSFIVIYCVLTLVISYFKFYFVFFSFCFFFYLFLKSKLLVFAVLTVVAYNTVFTWSASF